MLGLCGFAVMLGVGRLIFGLYGERININRVMIAGSLLAIACYVGVALSPYKWLSLVACGLTGLCVSLLWPGTLTEASAKLPTAGASMFALLAAGGDIGASFGPWITGVITDASASLPQGILGGLAATPEQLGLRIGILSAALLPVGSFLFQWMLRNKGKNNHG
jgi:MFS family permease